MAHTRTRRGRDRAGRTRRAVVLAALCLGVVAGPAAAQSASEPSGPPTVGADELGIEVVAGYDGHLLRSRWVPVEVTVAPDRFVAGTLRVLTEGNAGRQAEQREIEVAAGSVKVFRFVVPPTFGMTVELELPDARPVRVPVGTDSSARYLVGVLGDEVPDGAPPINAYALQTPATVVAVAADWLERSDRALDAVTTLVADASDLAALSDRAVVNLRTAVAAGLDLVAVADTDGPVTLPLPEAWVPATEAATRQVTAPGGEAAPARVLTPAPAAWTLRPMDLSMDAGEEPVAAAVNAGRGRVTVVGVGLGEGALGRSGALWGHVAPPVGITQGFESSGLQRIAGLAPEALRGDDFDLPPLGVLAIFLVVYVLAVGPVNGVVLSRLGRRELAWVTIPAITVVFAAAAWIGAAGSSPSVGLAGRATWWIDGQGGELAVAAIRDPRPGIHTVSLPGEGWAVTSATWNVPGLVDRSTRDTDIRFDLEAMEVGTAIGWRAHDRSAPLQLELVGGSGETRVRLRNLTTETVSNVRLHAATQRVDLGDLAPGEQIEHALSLDGPLPVRQGFGDDFEGLRGENGMVRAPAAMEALLRWDVLDGAPGLVWATGTVESTLDLGAVTADGAATANQGTFVAVGATPRPTGGDVSPFEVQRRLVVPGFGEVWQPGPLTIEGRAEAVLRFRLPRVEAMTALTSSLERGQMMNGRGFVEECFVQQVTDDDGNVIAEQEVCGDPAAPPPPPCPPDAASCSFDGRSLEVCDAEGACEVHDVLVPDVPEQVEGTDGLEVWDVVEAAWVPLDAVFREGSGDPGRLVSPLGEVLVRVNGELQPFDFSGRGIGIEAGEVDA